MTRKINASRRVNNGPILVGQIVELDLPDGHQLNHILNGSTRGLFKVTSISLYRHYKGKQEDAKPEDFELILSEFRDIPNPKSAYLENANYAKRVD